MSRPVHNNLLLTLLAAREHQPETGRYWIAEGQRRTIGVAFQSPLTYPVILTRMSAPLVRALVHKICEAGISLSGVNADAQTAARFAAEWAERTKVPVSATRALRLYEARRVRESRVTPGRFRQATHADEPLLAEWTQSFMSEVGEPAIDAAGVVARHVAAAQLWLWDDDGAVAMAAWRTPAAGVVRVGLVYTPPERRSRGYAGACVEALTKRVLAENNRCVLYADLQNPTANAIYRRIGYEGVCETLTFRFSETSSAGLRR